MKLWSMSLLRRLNICLMQKCKKHVLFFYCIAFCVLYCIFLNIITHSYVVFFILKVISVLAFKICFSSWASGYGVGLSNKKFGGCVQ